MYCLGMYVVSTKSIGFNVEVMNSDGSMVMTGIRVLLGSQDTTKVPSFIQVSFLKFNGLQAFY